MYCTQRLVEGQCASLQDSLRLPAPGTECGAESRLGHVKNDHPTAVGLRTWARPRRRRYEAVDTEISAIDLTGGRRGWSWVLRK